MSTNLNLPPFLLTDSYKWSHYTLYPDAKEMSAYGEFRHSFNQDPDDERLIVYGIRYIIDQYIARQWTAADLCLTRDFAQSHHSGYTPYPFPLKLFQDMIAENNGYFPVIIEAVPEGSVVYPHVPVFQITAKGKYSPLVTFLETLLSLIWYPTTVATLSRRCKDIIAQSFIRTVDGSDELTGAHPLLESRLHDFGFRGCTSVEQAVIGGSAHLLNFQGSDTLAACYYVQYHLNHGKPIGTSIPATEHSVMTAWPSEYEAMSNALDKYGTDIVACVMDSYGTLNKSKKESTYWRQLTKYNDLPDYTEALDKMLPSLKSIKIKKGGFLVLRPDSGDPLATVIQALRAADQCFGSTVNRKGYKVLVGVSVIQGDGLNETKLQNIINAVTGAGYSAENLAFGMGGGLLHRVTREHMSFATKLNYVQYADGSERDVMKAPKTDRGKMSLPGKIKVKMVDGVPMVYPKTFACPEENVLMRVVYDGTSIATTNTVTTHVWPSFEQVRSNLALHWCQQPKLHNPISDLLLKKQEDLRPK